MTVIEWIETVIACIKKMRGSAFSLPLQWKETTSSKCRSGMGRRPSSSGNSRMGRWWWWVINELLMRLQSCVPLQRRTPAGTVGHWGHEAIEATASSHCIKKKINEHIQRDICYLLIYFFICRWQIVFFYFIEQVLNFFTSFLFSQTLTFGGIQATRTYEKA